MYKFLFFFSICLVFNGYCLSDTIKKLWTEQFGTSENDTGYSIATDDYGYVYVIGVTQGLLYSSSDTFSSDIFIAKYDGFKNFIWGSQYGTSQIDSGFGIVCYNHNSIYITGSTEGSLEGNTNSGGPDIFITKYDETGTRLWTKQIGTPYSDIGYAIAVDSYGYVYVTGSTLGDLDGNISAGNSDIFLIKYDSEGNRIWTRQIGSNNFDEARCIKINNNGDVYLVGNTQGVLPGTSSYGLVDGFIIKYDIAGDVHWIRQFGTSSIDWPTGITEDNDNNVYVSGFTNGALPGNTNSGGRDVFVVKFSSSGDILWIKQFGSDKDDYGNSIAIDIHGNIFVGGDTKGGFDGNLNNGYNDIFLSKIDNSGNRIWTKQLGSSNTDFCSGIVTDNFGNIYIVGETYGSIDGNYNLGGDDAIIIKYGPTPLLDIDVTQIDFGNLNKGEKKTLSFNIKNLDVGTLNGTIVSDQPWIIVDPQSFIGNNIEVKVTVDNNILGKIEGKHSGTVSVFSNGGDKSVLITVTATCVLIKPNPVDFNITDKLVFFGSGIVPDQTIIKIYTISGELVKVISPFNLTTREFETKPIVNNEIFWDGKNESGEQVTSGIYIFTYTSPKEKGIGKFTVVDK